MHSMPRRMKPCLATTFILILTTVFPWLYRWRVELLTPSRPRITGLIVNSSACRLPDFSPWDDTVLDSLQNESPLAECVRDRPVSLSQRGLQLTMHVRWHQLRAGCEPECCLQSVLRDKEGRSDDAFRLGDEETCFQGRKTVNVSDEFVRVRCFCSGDESRTIYEDFRAFIVPKTGCQTERLTDRPDDGKKLNVYLVGIDSVSTLNFKRYMPRARQLLESELNAVPMLGLTKVGVNTFPNLIALLCGLKMEQMRQSLREEPFDIQPFVWNHFSALNYATMYAEDEPEFSTFNFLKKGFFRQPTDHYMRHLSLALEDSNVVERDEGHCVNDRLYFGMQLQWLEDFVAQPDVSPQFALVFSNAPSHKGPLSYIKPLQPRLLQFLKAYRSSARYNSSVLIVFSDHGMRVGPIMRTELGGYESRLPFFYVVLPPWYETRHPQRVANLRTNSRRLTTFFDVHATLRQLLVDAGAAASQLPAFPNPGLSLFAPVPEERSCSDAAIPPHWCVCRAYQPLSADGDVVIRAANATVRHINDVLLRQVRSQCVELRLLRVAIALLAVSEAGGQVLDTSYKLEAFDELSVRLVTEPGSAEFEATVRCYQGFGSSDLSQQREDAAEGLANRCRPGNRLSVMDVSRLNLYRGQSDCLTQHFDEKRFCYCRDLL